jgi:transposase
MLGKYILNVVENLIKKYKTRDPFELIERLGINLRYNYDLITLKGYYYLMNRERYIVINGNLSVEEKILVAAHELGHDRLHQHLAKVSSMKDFLLYDIPSKCIGCVNAGKCTSCGITDTRYEVDIRVDTKVIEHQTISFACQKKNGTVLTGTFSHNITGTMQYGDNLKALAVSLNTVGMMGIKRTHDILSAVFGISISTGTIFSIVKSCASKLVDTVMQIRCAVTSLPVAHFDETGTRVDKKTFWFHNASNEDFTYLTVEEKRGTIGMNASGVLPNFQRIAVHDCWKSYWSYGAVTHAICCAHLLRELTGVSENHPE